MPAFHRTVSFLLTAALAAICFGPAEAQASRRTLNQVSQLILSSYKHLTEDEITAARKDCEKAKTIEAQNKDPFITAAVAVCFGDVEDREENTEAACKHYALALESFKAVPVKHSARRTVKTHINVTEGKRLTLACGA